MSKVHLLAGPNNSGKSNVLRVVQLALPVLRSIGSLALADEDSPLGAVSDEDKQLRVGLLRSLEDQELDDVLEGKLPPGALKAVLAGPTFDDPSGGSWFEFELSAAGDGWAPSRQQIRAITTEGSGFADMDSWVVDLSGALTGHRGSPEDNALRVLTAVARKLHILDRIPDVKSIGAFRQINNADGIDTNAEFDGPGLILRLAQLQNPTFSEESNRARFDGINRFLQKLFDDPKAAIDVPHDRKTIIVQHQDRRLPLENYGTGIHEVVILAVAATVLTGTLLCIEEPEIHLHPMLQRKLLRYLVEQTDNQYLIATHSAHLLDSAMASISAVRLEEGQTRIAGAIEPHEVADISAELGARASDLVQANSVIWVEGPSDRIYIRGWLALLVPEFVEGIHYSIMFYGGTLLRHLSANDGAVEEFIRLPRINRNFSIVIDSDRAKQYARLNATKKRVRAEVEEASGHKAWITKGYTIENYVPSALLAEAVQAAHPGATSKWSGNIYQDPLAPLRIKNRKAKVDKTAIANEVMARWKDATGWPLDLRQQILNVADLVREANDA